MKGQFSKLSGHLAGADSLFVFSMALASAIYGNSARMPAGGVSEFLAMRITLANAVFAGSFMVAWAFCFRIFTRPQPCGLLRAIVGRQSISAGHITWNGTEVARMPAHARARLGIAYVPQGREIFPLLNVRENLETGFAPLARKETPHVLEQQSDLHHPAPDLDPFCGVGRMRLGGENGLERGPRVGRSARQLDDQEGFPTVVRNCGHVA